jgi:hypothetical protein
LSLAGKLEDVPLADVMQFIHLGRRTGTLSLQRAGEQAEITFHRGAIVGARSASSRLLGELLLEEGLIDEERLEAALREQQQEPEPRSLGQILLAGDTVSIEEVRDAIRGQIEKTIYELVTWAHGSFVFELDTLKPVDDIAVYPGDLIPDIDLNTQMVLLEAARIFDERNRAAGGGGEPAVPPPRPREPAGERRSEVADLFRPAPAAVERAEVEPPTVIRMPEEHEPLPEEPPEPPRLQLVVGDDDELAMLLATQLSLHGLVVDRVSAADAGSPGEGATPPIVAFELREGETTLRELAQICSRRPGLPVICVLDDVAMTAKAYEAGAAAVVPRDPDAILGCVASITRFRGLLTRQTGLEPGSRTAFAKLRRVVADLRSGVFSASVALNLMNIIAESVDRAVLFLVKRESLTALGAFGFNPEGRSLAEATRGLQVTLEPGSALTEAIRAGRAISVAFDEAKLPRSLAIPLGRPKTGQAVVFPVLGTDRVILLIYTDNGQLDQPIEEIDIIDLAASEVGIAFENELLRRQLSKK